METFTYRPTNEATGDIDFVMSIAQFGDGYRQEVPEGINPKVQVWPLKFVGTSAEIEEIENFITRNLGRAFLWRPPARRDFLGFRASRFTRNEVAADSLEVLTVTFTSTAKI